MSSKHQNDEDRDIFKDLSIDDSKELMTKGSSSRTDKSKNTIDFKEVVDVLLKIEKCKGVNFKDVIKEILSEFFIKVIKN